MSESNVAPSELQGGFGSFGAQKTFPCENCGAKLTFSIGAQSLKCDHCGFEKQLQFAEGARVQERDLEAALRGQASRRAETGQFAGTHEVKCTACGATVVFNGTLTSSNCSYCDAPIQREKAHEAQHRIPVDGLCTFRVEKQAASEKLRAWVKSRWFAPNEWKARGVDGRFDGVYMPFFTFDAMTFTRYTGERGDAYYVEVGSGQNKRKERRVKWSSARGAFQRFFDDVCIPALKSLPHPLLHKLEPWPLEDLVPFTDQALSGKLAHTYEVELNEGLGLAKQRIEQELTQDVRRRIGGDEQRIHSQDTAYSALTYKHVLLPVWILAYRYGGKSYRVVVNAMTGQVSGERPWSAIKIGLAVTAGLILALIFFALTKEPPPR
jgi:DNA-directed RNA polymerase subunit RPC12/RpoP